MFFKGRLALWFAKICIELFPNENDLFKNCVCIFYIKYITAKKILKLNIPQGPHQDDAQLSNIPFHLFIH
jgi:hypothetical protein